jgi:type II secretory pathway component GspD/PulD (secretin)
MNVRPLPIGLLAAITLSSGSIMAKDFNCNKLLECMEKASEITGDKYYSSSEIKGRVNSVNLKVDEGNVDSILSSALYDNGYVRVKESEGVYRVIKSRDARYNTFPLVSANKEKAPNLSLNYDFHLLEYKLEHPNSARVITKNLRPFLSRYGRAISPDGTGTIMVQDNARNLNRMYKVIKNLDVEISREMLRKIDQREKRHHAIVLAKTRKCSHEKLQ